MKRQLYTAKFRCSCSPPSLSLPSYCSLCPLSVSLSYEMSLYTPLAIGFFFHHPPFLSSHRLLCWTQQIRILCMYLIQIVHCARSLLRQFSQLHTHTPFTAVCSFVRLPELCDRVSRYPLLFLFPFLSLPHTLYICVQCTFLNNFNRKASSQASLCICLRAICYLIYTNLPLKLLMLPYVYSTHMCVVC